MSLLRSCFLCFIRLFWNHVFTCVSLSPSAVASSTLSGVDRYLWASNLFSRPVNCGSLNTVLAFLRLQCLSALTPIPRPNAISDIPQAPAGNKWAPPNKLAILRRRKSFIIQSVRFATSCVENLLNWKLNLPWDRK